MYRKPSSAWIKLRTQKYHVFVIIFYVGFHLARGYSSGDPHNHYKYTQHNHSNKNNQITHNVWSVAALFSSCSGVQGWVQTQNIPKLLFSIITKLPMSHPCPLLGCSAPPYLNYSRVSFLGLEEPSLEVIMFGKVMAQCSISFSGNFEFFYAQYYLD